MEHASGRFPPEDTGFVQFTSQVADKKESPMA